MLISCFEKCIQKEKQGFRDSRAGSMNEGSPNVTSHACCNSKRINLAVTSSITVVWRGCNTVSAVPLCK